MLLLAVFHGIFLAAIAVPKVENILPEYHNLTVQVGIGLKVEAPYLNPRRMPWTLSVRWMTKNSST